MKTVCIVGAGPAGLASAKVLLQTAQFAVSIFEQADKIGGIWNINQESPSNGFLHPDTPTNLSRFTVAFSDLDWHSVGLDTVPMFPKAWQVNRYLEAYTKKNIPSNVFRCGCKVVKTELVEEQWQVTTRDGKGEESVHHSDHLLLGSGFFSQPRPVHRDVPNVASDLGVKAIHSAKFRTLSDLFVDPADATGKTILMIGGGNSAGEAAAAVAQQLSDAWYSPNTGPQELYKGCRIVHVTPRPLYALPPYNPIDEQYQAFVPLDLKLYDLSKRPVGPVTGNAGELTPIVKDMIHKALQTQIGGDQSDLASPALTIPSQEPRSPVYVAISESYPEFVRSGLIEVVSGRVVEIKQEAGVSKTCSAKVENAETTLNFSNIGAVIYATGYSPSTALSFLPSDVKEKLHYDPTSARLPLVLSGWQTMSPTVPSLALIGFYEGPYWPIIEMQARFTAQRWLCPAESPTISNPYEEPSKLLTLRDSMKSHSLFIPQYWFGDYSGYMEQLASPFSSLLNLIRNDSPFASPRHGPVSPARYLWPGDDIQQATSTMHDLHRIWRECTLEGKFVARAVFRALQGNWKYRRTIQEPSHDVDNPNTQELTAIITTTTSEDLGSANFHPRKPTDENFDLEYLYIEQSTNSNPAPAPTPQSIPPRTKHSSYNSIYVYRYSEVRDELSIWSVVPSDSTSPSSSSSPHPPPYLFKVASLLHTLNFKSKSNPQAATKKEENKGIVAQASRTEGSMCGQDKEEEDSKIGYKFPMRGISLREWMREEVWKLSSVRVGRMRSEEEEEEKEEATKEKNEYVVKTEYFR